MSVNVKALRALHETWKGYAAMHGNDVHPDYRRELADALVEAAPDLLALAEAVRELAPFLRRAEVETRPIPTVNDRAAARRVLAILDHNPTNEGGGR